MKWNAVLLCIVLASGSSLAGCRRLPPPGGDTPLTVQRLSGARLVDIRDDLTWTFGESTVVIKNGDQPIPADLVESLLADSSTPTRIEAAWELDEASGTLRLSQLKAGQQRIDREVAIPIRPAGHVRVDLGARQYNVFPGGRKDP